MKPWSAWVFGLSDSSAIRSFCGWRFRSCKAGFPKRTKAIQVITLGVAMQIGWPNSRSPANRYRRGSQYKETRILSTQTLTVDDFKQSLSAHIAAKADEIRATYGPQIGWGELLQILQDRTAVRYPCEIVFDAKPLFAGEFAHPEPNSGSPEE